ncbi:uncharacterized protein V6R79_010473 [Siganus canaliculatus]
MVAQWLAAGAVQGRSEELEPAGRPSCHHSAKIGGGAGAIASKPIQLITSTTRNQRSTRQGYTAQCRRPGSSSTCMYDKPPSQTFVGSTRTILRETRDSVAMITRGRSGAPPATTAQ